MVFLKNEVSVRLHRLTVTGSLVLLIACGDDGPTTVTGLNGALSFTYSGAVSGTFNATGQMPTSPTAQETSAWAAGEVITTGTDAGTYAVAASPRTGGTYDLVVVVANRTNAGTATIDFDNCTDDVCSGVSFIIGQETGTGSGFDQLCGLASGTVVITEVTSSRIIGTFSGAGSCFSEGGTETAFTVTNGSFNVPIVPGAS